MDIIRGEQTKPVHLLELKVSVSVSLSDCLPVSGLAIKLSTKSCTVSVHPSSLDHTSPFSLLTVSPSPTARVGSSAVRPLLPPVGGSQRCL